MPAWVVDSYQEYARRLPRDCAMELIEVPAAKRTKQADIRRILHKEGEQILSHVDSGDWVVTLEVEGKAWTTPQLAKNLEKWQQRGGDVALLVGGPEGLAPECQLRANQRWSLSALTLPHPMVRVIVAEAVYRAWTLTVNHPYHRE